MESEFDKLIDFYENLPTITLTLENIGPKQKHCFNWNQKIFILIERENLFGHYKIDFELNQYGNIFFCLNEMIHMKKRFICLC